MAIDPLQPARNIVLLSLIAFGLLFCVVDSSVAQEADDRQAFESLMAEALQRHEAGEWDEAYKLHKKVTEDFPKQAGIGYYNMGCVHSLKKEDDEAFECLEKAVDLKFINLEQYQNDADLDNIKEDERFAKLIARIENGGKPVEEEESEEAKSPIAGNWKIVSGSRSGVEVPAERLTSIVVSDKDFTIPAGPSKFVMSYTLDETKSPMEVDMKIESGPAPDGSASGIISLDGTSMKLCYNAMGGDRPKEFKTSEGDNCFYFELEREIVEVSVESLMGTWEIVEGKRAGADSPAERLAGDVVFEKDSIALGDGEAAFGMSYSLDTDKSPVEIDMAITSGPAPEGAPAIGIIKFDAKGHLHLCYDGMGGARPDEFESTEDNGRFSFKLKKKAD